MTTNDVEHISLSCKFVNSKLEKSFKSFYIDKYLWQLRLAHILAIIFFVGAVLSEHFFIETQILSAKLRLSIVIPSFILGFIITFIFKDLYKKYFKIFNSYYVIITGLSFITTGYTAPFPYTYSFYSGLIVSLIFNFTFIRQSFAYASITGFILVFTYIALAFEQIINTDYLTHITIYILVVQFLGMFIAYTIEYDGRKSFLLLKHSIDKSNELKKAKENLEQKVQERTSELNIAKSKAEESDKLKTEFLNNMSHEIRTPLNGILGFSKLICKPNLNENKKLAYTKIIEEGGFRLTKIIEDIVDISMIESNQLELSLTEFNIKEFTNNIKKKIENHKTLRSKPELNLQFNFPDETTQTLRSDKLRLNQVIHNLLSNAIKYTDIGTVEFGYSLFENKIIFHIKDEGEGIPEDQKHKLFKRFTHIETNKIPDGTGVGLAISKGIIELLGGKIWHENNKPKGSVFKISLPLK